MTYKETIDRLDAIIRSHLMVETCGYGNISDIAVPDNEQPPNYPYVFINPIAVNLDRQSFNFNFNLIAMTQVKDKELDEIEGQDICIGILQDVVSQYLLSNQDPLFDITTPFSVTPFKERFQDDVVGAAAVLTINYGKAIDGCLVPF